MRFLVCIFFFLIGTASTAQDNVRVLSGFWIADQNPKVSMAIKQSENQYMAFRLSGNTRILSKKLRANGKTQAISDPFIASNLSKFTIPLRGWIDIPDPNSKNGGTKKKDVTVLLPASLDGEVLEIVSENGKNIVFRKAGFFESLPEYFKLVVSTISSFILFVIALIFYLKVLINRYRAISSLKVDRRYKEYKFKDGKSLKWMLFVLVLGIGVVFVLYHFLLGALGIGGFIDHVIFWTY